MKIPIRATIAVFVFFATFFSYCMRTDISVLIIPMTGGKIKTKHNFTKSECIHDDEIKEEASEYTGRELVNWSPVEQGHILGCYFYGYSVTCCFGGLVSEKIGARWVIGVTFVLSGLITILEAILAKIHWISMVLARILLGLMGGFLYPAIHTLISEWAPPHELGRFLASTQGGVLGTTISWQVLAFVAVIFNWETAFFLNGGASLAFGIIWLYYVRDDPEDHPHISESEKTYIKTALDGHVSKKKPLPPIFKMLRTVSFYALFILHFSNIFGLYFIVSIGPKYVYESLGMNLKKSAILAALPNLSRMFCAFIFGELEDYIAAKEVMSTTHLRKFLTIFSHVLPGTCFFCLILAKCNYILAVSLLVLAMGFNGAIIVTSICNPHDLAPNFAGSMYGFINGLSSPAGSLVSLLVALFTKDNHALENWAKVFYICGFLYIGGAIIFWIFGTAKLQDYNDLKTEST